MKQVIISLFILLTSFTCFGQKEHLNPVRNFSEYDGLLKNYYDSVFVLLYEGFNERPYASYTSMPSFYSEYAFSVEKKDDQYLIISNLLSQNFWYAKKRRHVRVNTSTTEIDEELFKAIGDLFQLLASRIKKPEDDMIGNDGTTYYFATVDSSGTTKIGETWSPNKVTLLARLVKICDNLFFIGQGKYISQATVQRDIQKLIADLRK